MTKYATSDIDRMVGINSMLQQYRGSIFKIPMLTQWMIVVTGPQLIEDMRRASDDQLSSKDAFAEVICHAYTRHSSNFMSATQTLHTDILFHPELHDDGFHIEVIRSHLTRNVMARFSDIQDEIAASFADALPTKGNGRDHHQVFLEKNS